MPCVWCGCRNIVSSQRVFVPVTCEGLQVDPHDGPDEEIVARCHRCGQPLNEPLTLATTRPCWRELDTKRSTVCSVAEGFELSIHRVVGLPLRKASSTWPPLPTEGGEPDFYPALESYIAPAHDLEELVFQMRNLFVTLAWAFDEGEWFEATEVADCGAVILGCCLAQNYEDVENDVGCGAFPGGRHMLGEGPGCPDDELYWGRWAHIVDPRDASHRPARALLQAARTALADLADIVELERDEGQLSGLSDIIRAWRTARDSLPEAVEVQLSLFPFTHYRTSTYPLPGTMYQVQRGDAIAALDSRGAP